MSKDMVHSPEAGLIPTEGLSALIAKLEAAEAGGPVLDRDIFSLFDERVPVEGIENGRYAFENEPGWYCSIPDFTTSLDAALALAERVLVSPYVGPISLTIMGSGQAFIDHIDPCGEGIGALGNTPALALCLAILKARTAASSNSVGMSEANAQKPQPLQEGVKP